MINFDHLAHNVCYEPVKFTCYTENDFGTVLYLQFHIQNCCAPSGPFSHILLLLNHLLRMMHTSKTASSQRTEVSSIWLLLCTT